MRKALGKLTCTSSGLDCIEEDRFDVGCKTPSEIGWGNATDSTESQFKNAIGNVTLTDMITIVGTMLLTGPFSP